MFQQAKQVNNSILNTHQTTVRFELQPADPSRCAELCGQFNEHLHQIEHHLDISIHSRGQCFELRGDARPVQIGEEVIQCLYTETATQSCLTPEKVHLCLQEKKMTQIDEPAEQADTVVRTQKKVIRPRGDNQRKYVHSLLNNDINFGVGPAGTGKTFLAVAAAVQALEQEKVRRILLVRPAVEAGEKLGFLPGDLAQKVDPYLRPLYDALYEMLGFERVGRLIERSVIEVAPLAYMRGRTLNDAFIILDESQNTTVAQMKMFLTRIGFGSIAVITGDVTQVDLPQQTRSGLSHALDVLKGLKGIGSVHFSTQDVVRHPLVQKIVDAYARHENTVHRDGHR